MIRTQRLLLPGLLFSLALPAQGPATLKIGTWNLEFLGADGDFRNKLPLRDDADYQKIGEKIRSLGVAVLAVQEISGDAPLRKVAAGESDSIGDTSTLLNPEVVEDIKSHALVS